MGNESAAVAVLTFFAKRFDEPLAHALTRHLDKPQRGNFCHLMLRAVTPQTLNEAAHNQVTVLLEHHVNEVDDEDAADIAQTQLTHDLFSGLKVVLSHGLFESSTSSGETARVDIDNRHGFSAINHERATRGQVDLAVHRLR